MAKYLNQQLTDAIKAKMDQAKGRLTWEQYLNRSADLWLAKTQGVTLNADQSKSVETVRSGRRRAKLAFTTPNKIAWDRSPNVKVYVPDIPDLFGRQ